MPASTWSARTPSPEMREMANEDPSIIVTGTVDDVRPYFERSKIFVNPVRIGGGFRGKLLEAMAMGLPIVSTSLGAEGVSPESGRDMIIADDPVAFADAVVELLNDPRLCLALGGKSQVAGRETLFLAKGSRRIGEGFKSSRRGLKPSRLRARS